VVAAKQVFRILKGERSAAMNRIANFLSRLPADKDFKVEISELKARRTEEQNRYLWGGIYKAILEQGHEQLGGYTAEDLHEYLLGEWSGWEMLTPAEGLGRKRLKPIRRSSALSKIEFSEFVDFIKQRMAEHGIIVPDAEGAI
jgi:hypothetical protein